jgi:predicted phosphodiesterase
MTRLALLADIHGNLPALEAVCADFAAFNVAHVIVAGDVINWGPFSPQVTERVMNAGWGLLRGNNEYYLLDYDTPRAPTEWRDRSKWTAAARLARQMTGR